MAGETNSENRMSGLYAAPITPVDERGRPDEHGLARLLDFVLNGGVDGVCLGGATGEYPRFSLEHRKRTVAAGARFLAGRAPFVTAIGAPTLRGVVELGEHALEHGSRVLLLPMPFFYAYAQQDLAAYAREVAQTLGAPCLLYNLPAFTNPIEPETALELLRTEPHLVGLKDSSGDRAALARLAAGRDEAGDYALLCGSDGCLYDALEAGWDGAVSGIASCAPEVLALLYRNYRAGNKAEARRCQDLLNELVSLVGRLPFPWSIRVACAARGLPGGPLPWPLAPGRRAEHDRLRAAYARWFDENMPLRDVEDGRTASNPKRL